MIEINQNYAKGNKSASNEQALWENFCVSQHFREIEAGKLDPVCSPNLIAGLNYAMQHFLTFLIVYSTF